MNIMKEFEQKAWKRDVETFDRWNKIYKNAVTEQAKNFAIRQLNRLQDKWPNHKLGDMPK